MNVSKKGGYMKYILIKFKLFLENIESVKNSKYFKDYINNLDTIDVKKYYIYVQTKMLPYKDKVDQYVDLTLKDWEIERTLLTNDEIIKFQRFISCFCDIASD